MEIIGKLIWFDQEEGCGQIRDLLGRKFYFDTSTIDTKSIKKLKANTFVFFKHNRKIKDCLCAHQIMIPTENQKRKADREFESRK